jgi:hypothetical protein
MANLRIERVNYLYSVLSLGGGGEAGGLLAVLLQLCEIFALPQRPLTVSLNVVLIRRLIQKGSVILTLF